MAMFNSYAAAGCDARGWILWQDRSRAIDRNLGQLGYPRNHALVIIIGCELFFVSFCFFCIRISFFRYVFVCLYLQFFFFIVYPFVYIYIYIYLSVYLSIYLLLYFFLSFIHVYIYVLLSFLIHLFIYVLFTYVIIYVYVNAYAYSFWALLLARPGLGFHGVTLPSISRPDVLHVTLTAESEKLGGERVRQGSPLGGNGVEMVKVLQTPGFLGVRWMKLWFFGAVLVAFLGTPDS